MKLFMMEKKVGSVRLLSRKILLLAQRNRWLVNRELLRHFCGVCVLPSPVLPLASFYNLSIYIDQAIAGREDRRNHCPEFRDEASGRPGRGRVRLPRQSLRQLRFWRQLTRGKGRRLHPCAPNLPPHSVAGDVGQDRTLGLNMQAGSQGMWEAQGF